MYHYDSADRSLLQARIAQFRDQTERYVAGTLAEEHFRPLRLMNGLYFQRHAPMLRITIPYGVITADQMRALADVCQNYDRGYGHFTTRQNFQLNWPRTEDVPNILATLGQHDMHSIQSSGNCVRNVTCDPLAGITPDELCDPRPWCELIRQWSTFNPEFSYLPRKFKIAVISSATDRAALRVHDLGLEVVQNQSGQTGFKVYVGGGLGRTPRLAQCLNEFLPDKELWRYVDAILRIYNEYGRRDNLWKARIKILIGALGIEQFRQEVDQEWQKSDERYITDHDLDWVNASFSKPISTPTHTPITDQTTKSPPAKWLAHNVLAHKNANYVNVVVTLKGHGLAPGDIRSEHMRYLAELSDRFGSGEMRTTYRQNLILANIPRHAIYAVWEALAQQDLTNTLHNHSTDVICCPGLDFCSLANAKTIDLSETIRQHLSKHALAQIPLNINTSGCMNACGHHHLADIGILGVDRKGKECYQIQIGGSAQGAETRFGQVLGPAVPAEQVPNKLSAIIRHYQQQQHAEESLAQVIDRIGLKSFKEVAYANHK